MSSLRRGLLDTESVAPGSTRTESPSPCGERFLRAHQEGIRGRAAGKEEGVGMAGRRAAGNSLGSAVVALCRNRANQ